MKKFIKLTFAAALISTFCLQNNQNIQATNSHIRTNTPTLKYDIGIGIEAPNLSLPNAQNLDSELKTLRGNLTVISFWASYENTGRAFNKKIAALQNQYAGTAIGEGVGLKVFAVSLDGDKTEWQQAIKADDTNNFTNVFDIYSSSVNVYKLTNMPANFLVDEKGYIIAQNITPEKLNEILQSKTQATATITPPPTAVATVNTAKKTILYGNSRTGTYTFDDLANPQAIITASKTDNNDLSIAEAVNTITNTATPTTIVPLANHEVPKTYNEQQKQRKVADTTPPPANKNTSAEASNPKTYKIQLGAFKNPKLSDYYKFSDIGNVSTESAPNGIKRIMLGEYNEAEAKRILDKVKAMGYNDAFMVLNKTNAAPAPTVAPPPQKLVPVSDETNVMPPRTTTQTKLETKKSAPISNEINVMPPPITTTTQTKLETKNNTPIPTTYEYQSTQKSTISADVTPPATYNSNAVTTYAPPPPAPCPQLVKVVPPTAPATLSDNVIATYGSFDDDVPVNEKIVYTAQTVVGEQVANQKPVFSNTTFNPVSTPSGSISEVYTLPSTAVTTYSPSTQQTTTTTLPQGTVTTSNGAVVYKPNTSSVTTTVLPNQKDRNNNTANTTTTNNATTSRLQNVSDRPVTTPTTTPTTATTTSTATPTTANPSYTPQDAKSLSDAIDIYFQKNEYLTIDGKVKSKKLERKERKKKK